MAQIRCRGFGADSKYNPLDPQTSEMASLRGVPRVVSAGSLVPGVSMSTLEETRRNVEAARRSRVENEVVQ